VRPASGSMKSRLAFVACRDPRSTLSWGGAALQNPTKSVDLTAQRIPSMDGLILAFGLLGSLLVMDILAVVFGVDSRESILEEHTPNL